jgi:hypothetical protein
MLAAGRGEIASFPLQWAERSRISAKGTSSRPLRIKRYLRRTFGPSEIRYGRPESGLLSYVPLHTQKTDAAQHAATKYDLLYSQGGNLAAVQDAIVAAGDSIPRGALIGRSKKGALPPMPAAMAGGVQPRSVRKEAKVIDNSGSPEEVGGHWLKSCAVLGHRE